MAQQLSASGQLPAIVAIAIAMVIAIAIANVVTKLQGGRFILPSLFFIKTKVFVKENVCAEYLFLDKSSFLYRARKKRKVASHPLQRRATFEFW